ncbi:Vps41p KNAG_0D01820 [Huiozyma naganishii CBS 8797]|uniref:Vacuolar protein sorting-associated protein 41 n=1 Tax=Huiozyma naganishii (strain ATCC MYA-139 / BCRC 22969 / CBS 8797 / KCTC 17520 / NBRC 10181 / NCYC 3082 / Yp74L-3) TaxID=1071383 RepID=J7RK94_HUIN7|nr:hypothetical protein KNAG_0D01820 [Kazachstania naganishii CBS 8797]CCK69933.1 hypothetical protein KNAG_0D01820 [Kazachstania naganishii CBS 8797]
MPQSEEDASVHETVTINDPVTTLKNDSEGDQPQNGGPDTTDHPQNALEGGESRSTSDEESQSDSDTEDEPPTVKYSRISKLPQSFFQRDSISCCKFSESRFLFGTHSGLLHLTHSDFSPIKTLKCHRSSIMSIYCNTEYFATASMDGTVIIGAFDDFNNLTAFDFKRPVHAVVLDDDYKTNKTFLSGGMAGEIVLSQRNWLGNRMDRVISKGNGIVSGIHKLGTVIFWMNDLGVTFFDINSKSELLNVPFESENQNGIRPDLLKPQVHFPEVDRIIIGWADNVWLFKVSLILPTAKNDITNNLGSIISSATSSLRPLPDKKVELERHFRIPLLLAGIVSFKDDQLLCLGFDYTTDLEMKFKGETPHLKTFDTMTGEEMNDEEVVIKNYEKLSINDYHLGKYIHGTSMPKYFLISATDFIMIEEFSLYDHYKWFLNHNMILKAWDLAQYLDISYEERLELGISYLNAEIEAGSIDDVGTKISKIFGPCKEEVIMNNNSDLHHYVVRQWQGVILKLINERHVNDNLIDNIPIEPRLDKSLYDTILLRYLYESDGKDKFTALLSKWDVSLYSEEIIQGHLETLVRKKDSNCAFYRERLIYTYLQSEKYSKAVPHMLEIKDKNVIHLLINNEQLIPQFTDILINIVLLPFDSPDLNGISDLSKTETKQIFKSSIRLLVVASRHISVSRIITLFEQNEANLDLNLLLLCFLEQLPTNEQTITEQFEDKMVILYSKYDSTKLLRFLKDKTSYNVEKAIDICTAQSGLYNELIYLWGKIGETKKALSIIVDELDDAVLAVDFVKSWGDVELWDFLIGYTMNKPNFVELLLQNYNALGDKYISVVQGVDDDLNINGLHRILSETLNENSLSLRVKKNIFQIVDDETNLYAKELLTIRDQGKVFEGNA